jgi:hypothetical protein
MDNATARRRPLGILAIGALAGVMLGIGAALHRRAIDARALPPEALATVNGKVIRRAEYARVLEAIASDRRGELSASDRKMALDRLIEQELLIQHGVALGLVESDRAVREAIVRAMLASITASMEEPSDDQLGAFYAANQADFVDANGKPQPMPAAVIASKPPALDVLRPVVTAEYHRRARDKALRDYLDRLRSSARILTMPEVPR